MAGSIDLNSNRGIAIVLGLAALVGGGASTLKDQVFGPGGDWEKIVTNQAVQAEQIKGIDSRFAELTTVLKDGFASIADAEKEHDDEMKELRKNVNENTGRINSVNQELEYLHTRLMEILQEDKSP